MKWKHVPTGSTPKNSTILVKKFYVVYLPSWHHTRIAQSRLTENLQELDEPGEMYDSMENVWPDYTTKGDFIFNEDEY